MGWSIFYSIFLVFFCLACEPKNKETFVYYDEKLDNLIYFLQAFKEKNYEKLYGISQKLKLDDKQIRNILYYSLHKKYKEKLLLLIKKQKWDTIEKVLNELKEEESFFLYKNFVELCKGLNLLKTKFLSKTEFILLRKKEKDFFFLLKTLNKDNEFSFLEEFLRKNNYFFLMDSLENKL